MHKYRMEIVCECIDAAEKTVISLPNTSFIVVSAYHNNELIKLKILNNPCANAFKHQILGPGNEHYNNGIPAFPSPPENGKYLYKREELQMGDYVSY